MRKSTKLCKHCGHHRPLSEFYRKKHDTYTDKCLGCEIKALYTPSTGMRNDLILGRLNSANQEELQEICKALGIAETSDARTISAAYRSAAGHSLANLFRGEHDLPYKQILIDVADKLKPGLIWTTYRLADSHSEERIEETIERYIFDRIKAEWDALTPQARKAKEQGIRKELRKKGYSQAVIGSVTPVLIGGAAGLAAAAPVTLRIFYSGFFASIVARVFGPSSSLLLLSGTGVGLLVSIPLLIVALGSPAYRKTIPATVQFIRIRRRLEGESLL